VNWRVVCASVVGTSHLQNGTACQDSCWAQVAQLPGDQTLLSVFVADGAGSASRGGDGAELGIEAAAAFVAQRITAGNFTLDTAFAADLVLAVRERIFTEANGTALSSRDFACTLIGVLSSANDTLVLQIGDGAAVIDVGDGLNVAIPPMSGEYANMTNFVTDDDAMAILAIRTYSAPALRVAVLTDGIQRLSINLANNTPHAPFFHPFFDGMTKATAEQEDQLQALLVQFLGSEAVNSRTDDDKSLALAVMLA